MPYSRLSAPARLIASLPFARGTALRVWYRIQRLRGETMVWTAFGARMRCDARDIIQASIVHFGVWEPAATRAFDKMIESGDVVVDLGANIGYFSLLFAKKVGPRGEVIAVEALPRLAERVRLHAALNDFDNITVINAAVAAKPMTLTMFEAPGSNSGASTIRSDRGFPISCVVEGLPLTQLLSPDQQRRTTLIKCDIEGAELPVMHHLLDNLANFPALRVVAVEANRTEEPNWPALFDRFVAAGFRILLLPADIRDTWRHLLDGETESDPNEIYELPARTSDLLIVRG